MRYDLIIAGGGIAGLYLGWYYQALNPEKRTLILEASGRIGGRILTGNWNGTTYEIGAGRISSSDELTMALLAHFRLGLKEIDSGFTFVGSSKNKNNKSLSYTNVMLKLLPIFAKLKAVSVFLDRETLISRTIGDLMSQYLSRQEQTDLQLYFPYYSEVYIENAYEGLTAIGSFSFAHRFYVLKGGLETLVKKIAKCYLKNGGEIQLETALTDFQSLSTKNVACLTTKGLLSGKKLVVTCNLDGLKKIRSLKGVTEIMDTLGVQVQSLLRIYAVYPKNGDGEVWFKGLGRIVTDLPIRLIIPIDQGSGLIMISYTDGTDADWWYRRQSESIAGEIKRQLSQLFPDKEIPDPVWLRPYFWREGGNYTGPNSRGLDRRGIGDIVEQQLPENVLVVNNALGPKKNWIEGSLLSVYEKLPVILCHTIARDD